MKKVVLDTNILIAISQFKLDVLRALDRQIEEKYELFVIDKTIEELEKLINKARLSEKKAAKLALSIIRAKNIPIIKTEGKGTADDELIKLKGYAIATQDKELKEKLKTQGTEVLTIKQKKNIVKG